jgi:hypothetical protein
LAIHHKRSLETVIFRNIIGLLVRWRFAALRFSKARHIQHLYGRKGGKVETV